MSRVVGRIVARGGDLICEIVDDPVNPVRWGQVDQRLQRTFRFHRTPPYTESIYAVAAREITEFFGAYAVLEVVDAGYFEPVPRKQLRPGEVD